MTTYQPANGTMQAAWIFALLRDLAIVVAVVIYAIDTL